MALWEQSTPTQTQKENIPQWQSSAPVEADTAFDEEIAGQVYDTSVNNDIPINEAENLYAVTNVQQPQPTNNLANRFLKQYYNSAIANTVNTIATKSEFGKLGTDLNMMTGFREDFFRRAEAGEPVTEQEIMIYATPRRVLQTGKIEMQNLDERAFRIFLKNKNGELNIRPPLSPKETLDQFLMIKGEAEQKSFQQTDISANVPEATNLSEKITDAAAGVAGFTTQITVMKQAAPSMPDWLVWENVNLANGGTPGAGVAMQLTLGGLGRAIPGTGFTPAVARGTAAGTLFGTATYLGGGDTTDILISAGIPFAFEGIGLTKQTWAKYKNKKTMIQAIKEKAPNLKNRSDVEVDKAITDLLTNVEMQEKFKPKKALNDVSAEVKNYIQQKRYDELLAKANTGDKSAIRELNDYIQGVNIPTYDELLERGFNGDQNAFDLISAGEYKGGSNQPESVFKMPKQKQVGAKFKAPKEAPTINREAIQQKVYMKGFAARLTSIRNNADNLVAGAGKKRTQIKTIKTELDLIQKHYESIAGDIAQYRSMLPELAEIQRLLPDYAKAVNEFVGAPTKEGFSALKTVGDKIANLSTAYGEQITTAQAKEIPATEVKTPIQKAREQIQFAENEDTKPGTLSPADLKRSRERGFITSVKEVLPELKIEGQYIPRATDPLAIKARNLVMDNIDMAEKLARSSINDKAVATASELIKHYGQKGETAKSKVEAQMYYDKAADVANMIAVKLTEAGRTVQAASILGRMTPEGQVRFAAREIQRYNEKIASKKGGLGGLKKQIPELTAKQAKYILDEMARIEKMPEGKERHIQFQKLQNYIADLTPTSLYRKIVTVWKAGLLTGIRTHGLNIFANAAHLGTESVSEIPASIVDKTVSYFTGKRTVTPTIKGLGKGTIEGLGEGIEYIKSGYSKRDIGLKLDYKKISFGKGNLARALNAGTDSVFRLLGAADQPFYYAAKLRSLYEQAKVSAINLGLKGKAAKDHIDNLLRNPTEKMIDFATKDAETAVFINKTKLGDIARGIQQLPGGEIIVPFGRTPSAIAMQIVNYSPAGIAKTVIENIGKGRFDQRTFSQGLGRGLTGTAVLVIGTHLYTHGLIALDQPTTEKERKLWELEGRRPNTVKIGNAWRSIQTFGPAGNLLIIGGHFQRAFEEVGSPTEAMTEALSGTAKSFTEQTFLQGVNMFVDALSDPKRSAPFVAGSVISSIVPTILADVAKATDTQERRTETISEKVMSRVPGLRQKLEPSINVLGEERQPTANPVELLIDPTRPSKDISTPVVTELRRLWDQGWEVSPNLLGGAKGYDVLTQQENTELWKRAGTITKEGLTTLIENPLYSNIPDDKKAELITKIINESQKIARTEMVAKQLTGLEGTELTQRIFELRQSGLADQGIIPISLSKRNPRKAQKEISKKKAM